MGASKERMGKPSLPEWWKDLARPEIDKWRNAELAKQASDLLKRKTRLGGDAITKLLTGSAVTREFANAVSWVLGIPQPYFEARSAQESCAVLGVMELNEPVIPPIVREVPQDAVGTIPPPLAAGSARIARRNLVSAELQRAVQPTKDQSGGVPSKDERSPRSLGSRRASARRQKTSRS